jgi:hypothetical protein
MVKPLFGNKVIWKESMDALVSDTNKGAKYGCDSEA